MTLRVMTGRSKRTPRGVHPDLQGLPARLVEALAGREQKWLSKHSGVDEGGISRLLRGLSLTGVTADTILRLARALGVSPGWLLSGDGLREGVWIQVDPSSVARLQGKPQPGTPVGDESGRPNKHRK